MYSAKNHVTRFRRLGEFDKEGHKVYTINSLKTCKTHKLSM